MSKKEINKYLGQDGVFASELENFSVRDVQIEMAEAVLKTVKNKKTLFVEAGTGTGKTFAYLLPLLLSKKKVIISTGTKHLQDQLFFRDIPDLRKILKKSIFSALLKGRANYLCLHRMHQHHEVGEFDSRSLVADLLKVVDWRVITEKGDLTEIESSLSGPGIIPYVTSNSENCLGQDCEHLADCYLLKARKQAQEADIVVVNHHLYFADSQVQQLEKGNLLPKADAVIFDEAHLLPEIAMQFMGQHVGTRQLVHLAEDCLLLYENIAKDCEPLKKKSDALITLSYGIKEFCSSENVRDERSSLLRQNDFVEALYVIQDVLLELINVLKLNSERDRQIEITYERAHDYFNALNAFLEGKDESCVYWYESYTASLILHVTPIRFDNDDVELFAQKAKIFTSATLCVGDNYSYFEEQLGLKADMTLRLKSHYEYEKQALFYTPRGLPDVKDQSFISTFMQNVIPLIESCGGKTLLLFTSYAAMNKAHDILQSKLVLKILKQGDAPKHDLVNQLRSGEIHVLLGTYSFWEGIDLPGKALSLLIIDKLPFASPGDPILAARIKHMREQGLNPFNHLQLPKAVLNLKQGVGRLIRSESDCGIVILGDNRITGKYYGKLFFDSLPPMKHTRELKTVQQFINENILDEAICK